MYQFTDNDLAAMSDYKSSPYFLDGYLLEISIARSVRSTVVIVKFPGGIRAIIWHEQRIIANAEIASFLDHIDGYMAS